MKRKDKFLQGYICCIVTMIKSHGLETPIEEAYRAGAGNMSLEDLKEAGVDAYDLEIIEQHWNDLKSKQNQ